MSNDAVHLYLSANEKLGIDLLRAEASKANERYYCTFIQYHVSCLVIDEKQDDYTAAGED